MEEQFYIVAPLLIGAVWLTGTWTSPNRSPARLLAFAAGILFTLSLAGSIAWSTPAGARNPGFYLTPLRAWEFIAGGSIPLLLPWARRLGGHRLSVLAAAGLAAIAGASLFLSAHDVYPGALALLPVGGAVAVLTAGLAGAGGPAIRLLASRPMVAIGLVSYSWYLWHWPLIAFANFRLFGESEVLLNLTLSAVALLLATGTYLLVERPIRRLRQTSRIGLSWKPVVLGLVACIAVAVVSRQGMEAVGDRAASYLPIAYKPKADGAMPLCDLSLVEDGAECAERAAGRPMTLAIGDSVLLVPRDALADAASDHGGFLVMASAPACAALLAAEIFPYDPALRPPCKSLHTKLPELLSQMGDAGSSPRAAILYSSWQSYLSPTIRTLGEPGSDVVAADQPKLFVNGLRGTIDFLRAAGVERILIVGPTPLFRRPVPNCLALADRIGADRTLACGVRRADYDQETGPASKLITEAVAAAEGIRVIWPTDQFCDADWCRPWLDDAVFWMDRSHLSDAGLERIIAAHSKDVDWLFGRPPTR